MDETFASSFCARLDLKKKMHRKGAKKVSKEQIFIFFDNFLQLFYCLFYMNDKVKILNTNVNGI